MLEWLTNTLPSVLTNIPALAFLLVFIGGIITRIIEYKSYISGYSWGNENEHRENV